MRGRFDPARTSSLRREEVDHLACHVALLITGQGTAASEWAHFGFSIELEEDMDQGDGGELVQLGNRGGMRPDWTFSQQLARPGGGMTSEAELT